MELEREFIFRGEKVKVFFVLSKTSYLAERLDGYFKGTYCYVLLEN